MAKLTLKTLLGPKNGAAAAVAGLMQVLGGDVAIEDGSGKLLMGEGDAGAARVAVEHDGVTLGFVRGERPEALSAIALMLAHLAARESERRALAGEVLHLYREVNLIERLSEQLAATVDLSAVGESSLDQARQLIRASQGTVLVIGEDGGSMHSIASFGPEADFSQQASKTVESGIGEILNGAESSSLCVPLRAKQRTVGAIALANGAEAPYFTTDLKLLNTIALQTAAAIENSFLCAEMVNAVRNREQLAAIQKELDTARTIQHSLIPRVFPPFPHRKDFDIHAQMTSAKAVGGDFFDFFLIDEDHLGLLIGDVSGKGTPAALYMAVTRTHIRTTALQGKAPAECLLDVNRVLVREKASSMFATCLYGILDTRSGELNYCRAGHNPPYVLRASGAVEPTGIETGGPPLGMLRVSRYTGSSVQLGSGDALFLYTDGVPEANNAAMDDFTDERLMAVLGDATSRSCRGIVDHVTSELLAFTAGAAQFDDITMLAVRRN